jgi:hypothetical protein
MLVYRVIVAFLIPSFPDELNIFGKTAICAITFCVSKANFLISFSDHSFSR